MRLFSDFSIKLAVLGYWRDIKSILLKTNSVKERKQVANYCGNWVYATYCAYFDTYR